MRESIRILGVFLLVASLSSADAKDQGSNAPKKIIFNSKVEVEEIPGPVASAPVPASGGYATVKYSIGTPEQKARLQQIISTIATALPSQLGNSAGTYTVTLTMTDLGGNLLVKEPILSFQWTS